MLNTTDISALLFNTKKGSQLIDQLNRQLDILIKNDLGLLDDNQNSPGIWEQKWANDSSVNGYRIGQSVWLNTQTPTDILNTRYKQVEQYVLDNPFLAPMYNSIDQNDQEKINEFFIKAITGTAHRSVSALYYLGELSSPVQIKISDVSNNKDFPTASSWHDFYVSSTKDENVKLMASILSSSIGTGITEHRKTYHDQISGMTGTVLDEMGFFKASPFALSSVQTQAFYDHEYCDQLNGFDCAISTTTAVDCSMRLWKSGYLEQWGYAENTGDQTIRVQFKCPYNYALGNDFYQSQFGNFNGTDVDGRVIGSNRYIVVVTPAIANSNNMYVADNVPYPETPKIVAEQKMYVCVDVTKIDNDGFSIVNADVEKKMYTGYYWSTCGYTTTS